MKPKLVKVNPSFSREQIILKKKLTFIDLFAGIGYIIT